MFEMIEFDEYGRMNRMTTPTVRPYATVTTAGLRYARRSPCDGALPGGERGVLQFMTYDEFGQRRVEDRTAPDEVRLSPSEPSPEVIETVSAGRVA
jgi:hypothetical protein